MKLSGTRGRKKARLEIIPLIDIMFFLVATFMMVSLSMIKNEGVDVTLPIAASGRTVNREDSATLTVDRNGELYFNKDKVTLDDLKSRVVDFRAASPEARFLLNCDKDARMEKAMEVLDALRMMGISNVALQTQAAP